MTEKRKENPRVRTVGLRSGEAEFAEKRKTRRKRKRRRRRRRRRNPRTQAEACATGGYS
jgi:hypothetical protein